MSDKKATPYRRGKDNITVVIKAENFDTPMTDFRPRKGRQALGTVRECLAQYGLTYKELNGTIRLMAPRERMQLFMEKLHYSGLKYKVEGKKL